MLQDKYGSSGYTALAFPCNQFGENTMFCFPFPSIAPSQPHHSSYPVHTQCLVSISLSPSQPHHFHFPYTGGQEPGTNAEVQAFAKAKGAAYPVFAKIDVNGDNEGKEEATYPPTHLHPLTHLHLPTSRSALHVPEEEHQGLPALFPPHSLELW